MCRAHRLLYQVRVKNHTCSDADCADRCFANLDKNDQSITECVHHMKLRLQQEGDGEGNFRENDDNISVTSSKGPSLHKLATPSKRVTNESSRSESSELEDREDLNNLPSLTKHLNAVNPVNLFQPKRTQGDHQEYGLRRAQNSSSEDEGG